MLVTDHHFEIDRTDHSSTRWVDSPAGDLGPGEIALELQSFALTSNNISYVMAGDSLDYWGFFPAEAPFGRVPVMGHGVVTESNHPDIEVGGRYFGFFPITNRHVVLAQPSASGFRDVGEHRAKHAAVYRSFDLVTDADPASASADTAHRVLLVRGLFITSWLIDDFLVDNQMFGASQVLVTSASSKTSIALAYALKHSGQAISIGLTSASNRDFVESLDLYDEVVTYDELEAIDAAAPSVIVDMAGNTGLLADLHTRLADLRHSCRVGATHWEAAGAGPEIPAPVPEFFFAPSQIQKRADEWGTAELNARMGAALAGFVADTERWMTVEVSSGTEAVQALFEATRGGEVAPSAGQIGTLVAP
jgi:hypothetical protein